ncbi:MAG: GyrI-like domain-containing protein [Thermomicrobiales bacterium]|nr:GyrI-like domain-containing protein [Thermomicrobiales bacterium]
MLDFKKDPLYKAKRTPALVDVPEMTFVMIDGEGAPDSSDEAAGALQQAMSAIYGIVYSIKFWTKKHPAPPGYDAFSMPPVEGLWWMKDERPFDLTRPADWRWTVMHRLPDFVTSEYFAEVVEAVVEQKQSEEFRTARLERFAEGESAQILHIGPYDEEAPTIARLMEFIETSGYEPRGRHHELYFNDPSKVAPEKLKTIIRQPIAERESDGK